MFWPFKRNTRNTPITSVTLRSIQDEEGTRTLSARIDSGGDLVIDGRDYGAGVRKIFDYSEYEWVWTINRSNLDKLAQRLGGQQADLLRLLAARFSGDDAGDLLPFLDANEIAYEVWSRIGD